MSTMCRIMRYTASKPARRRLQTNTSEVSVFARVVFRGGSEADRALVAGAAGTVAVAFASLVSSAAVHAFSLTMIGNPVEIADPSLKEREENALAAYDRINAMIKDGKLTEALTAAETAIKDYAGCPDGLHLLRGAKVYLLVRLPDKKKAADKFAADWIADIKRERNPLHEFRFLDIRVERIAPVELFGRQAHAGFERRNQRPWRGSDYHLDLLIEV